MPETENHNVSTQPEKKGEPESQRDANVVPLGRIIPETDDDDFAPPPGKVQIEQETLQEIFDGDKSSALGIVATLAEIIQDIELDPYFDEEAASDENRPMRALALAHLLTRRLESIECLKIIVTNED